MDKKFTIMFDEKLMKEVDEVAKDSKRSRSKFIEFVVREYLKEQDSVLVINVKPDNLLQ